MRRILLFLAILWTTPTTAQQVVVPPTDGDWNVYCIGFFNEISQQATLVNNALLFNHAQTAMKALQAENFINIMSDKWAGTSGTDYFSLGTKAAGKGMWEAAPLLGNAEKQRETIYALRQPVMDHCDDMSSAAQVRGYPERAKNLLRAAKSVH